MRLHSYDPKHKNEAWKTWFHGSQRRIIRDVEKVFSDSHPTQQKVRVAGKSADATLHTNHKRRRSFLKEHVKGKNIIIVSEVFSKRFREKQVLVLRSTATKEVNILKVGNEGKDK